MYKISCDNSNILSRFVDDLAKKSEDQHLTDGEKIAKIASQYEEKSFTDLTDKELRKINVDARAAALFQLREEQQAARASNTRDDNDPFWKGREFEVNIFSISIMSARS